MEERLRGFQDPGRRTTQPDETRALLLQAKQHGFADKQLTQDDVENGGVAPPGRDSAILIVYTRAIALLPGDEVEMTLTGPGGLSLHDRRPPLPRWRAQELWLEACRRAAEADKGR